MKPLYRVLRHRKKPHPRGNRVLTELWPTPAEQRWTCTPKYAYMNEIGPKDTAGNHYHLEKVELFCPLGRLDLYLEDVKTGKRATVHMDNPKREYKLYYIPRGVSHAIHNPGTKPVTLIILSEKKENRKDHRRYPVYG